MLRTSLRTASGRARWSAASGSTGWDHALTWELERAGGGAELVVRPRTPQRRGQRAEVVQPAMTSRRSLKAERRQSRLAPKPSAFCWLSASGIAPVRVLLAMNVHPACHNVNTLFVVSRILLRLNWLTSK